MSRFRRNRLAELQVDGRVIRQHEIEASRNGICRRRRRGFVISGPRPRGLRRGAKRRLSAGPVFEQDKAPFPYVSGLPVGGTHAEETLVAPGDLNLLAALPYSSAKQATREGEGPRALCKKVRSFKKRHARAGIAPCTRMRTLRCDMALTPALFGVCLIS